MGDEQSGGEVRINHSGWLVKQEPSDYGWEEFVREGRTAWTGIRNFQSRNHLREMAVGELVIWYHSGEAREAVGVARVVRGAYPDPTATEGDWSCVDLAPVVAMRRAVSLVEIKADAALRDMVLVRHPRLSVQPVTAVQLRRLLELGETTLP